MVKSMLAAMISFLLVCSYLASDVIADTEQLCTEEGSVKLDNTFNDSHVLAICSMGKWGYVCGENQQNATIPWTKENAGVACQQLGYIREGSSSVRQLTQNESSELPLSTVHYRFIQCTGVEKRLIDCPHGTSSDINKNSCKKDGKYSFGIAPCTEKPVNCSTPGELKIVNNTNTVQICSQGEWYSICTNENEWTKSQAQVACRQMGLNPNEAKPITPMKNSDNDKILNVAFHCEGHENTLSECSSSITEGGTSTIAGVMCGDQTAPPQNVSASSGNSQMIAVSWDYDDNDIINTSVIFHVTCTGNSITLSTIINGTQDLMIHFPGVMPGVQYDCCVDAGSPNGRRSETVCDSVSIDKIVVSTTDNLTQTTSATDYTTANEVSSSAIDNSQFNRQTTSLLLSASQSTTTSQLVLHSTTTSSNSIRDQTNAEFVTSGQSSSIAWSVGVLVGIVIGMMAVILILFCYILCYKRFKNRRKISIKSKTCDMASNSVELRTGINDPICNPTYGSHPVTISGSSIAKPTDPIDGQYNNIIYEPVYTDADMPEVDNVYSLLSESEQNKR